MCSYHQAILEAYGLPRETQVAAAAEETDWAQRGEHRLARDEGEHDHPGGRRDSRDTESRVKRRAHFLRRPSCFEHPHAVVYRSERDDDEVHQEERRQPILCGGCGKLRCRQRRGTRMDCERRKKDQRRHRQTGHRNDASRFVEDAPDLHMRRAPLAREDRRPERREPRQARGDMKR